MLVNNAGAFTHMPFASTTAATITDRFAPNVTAPSLLSHHAFPYLSRIRGPIAHPAKTLACRNAR